MMSGILFRNVRLVDHSGVQQGELLLRHGKIDRIGLRLEPEQGERVIDGGGKVLMPAFVDLHAHFRDPGLTHKEDIESGSRAAVHGGFSTVNLMANTRPVCSSPETVRYVRQKAAGIGLCDVYQTVSITRDFDGATLDHLEELEESVRWISDDGYGVQDTGVMLRAMELAREKGIGVMLHEEDAALTKQDSYRMEEVMTRRDVELALLTGCKTHFCHVSTIRAMESILKAKRRGGDITCEVTPHHLLLNDECDGKVAPPLRGEAHRRFLVSCVRQGLVDAIATDHAPHTPEDKAGGANGFTGLDLAFAACNTALVREGFIGLPELSRLMSLGPARLMGLSRGALRPGMDGDLVLIDPDAAFVVDESRIHSKSGNTPLMGRVLYGEVLLTTREGNIVYEKTH